MNSAQPSSGPIELAAGRSRTALTAIFFVLAAWLLFANLGRASLFEPDEGRNAEIAREILLLGDWLTPHYDFLPRLDKPIFYFDLVALSFRLFGVSEWSARFPSALAALGCLALTYRLSRALHGSTAASWSALVLLTSVGFFTLSQIVILDMLFTFFLTLGLSCFFWGERKAEWGSARPQFLCMYVAFGAATLTKGPLGFLLPGMMIAAYVLVTRRWGLWRRMDLPLGVVLFLLTTGPWYLSAELRHPGYLRHFLLEENFARFSSTRFHRTQPWYFYLLALPAGFFPWTFLLPRAAACRLRRPVGRESVLLILWVLAPLVFFSFSYSKMAHYILPIVPALAILVGATFSQAHPVSTKIMRPEAFAGCAYLCLAAALVVALVWPQILPRSLEIYANSGWRHPSLAAIAGIFATLSLLAVMRPRVWRNASGLYAATMAGFALVVQLSPAVTAQVAEHRSSRLLAEATSAHIHPEDQLVLYGGYPSSLPFYLELRRPIWVVWSENKRQVLGSDYVALQRPAPAPGYGRVLYGEEEISQLWRNSNQRMIAFVPNKALDRFAALAGAAAHILLRNDDMVLIANRLSGRQTPAMPPDGNHERVAMRNSHGNLDNHDGIVNLDR